MGRRGRAPIVICDACGRRVPREKAVSYEKGIVFSTDMRTKEDVKVFESRKNYYCVSCGKSRRIFEKKKKQRMRKYNK